MNDLNTKVVKNGRQTEFDMSQARQMMTHSNAADASLGGQKGSNLEVHKRTVRGREAGLGLCWFC